MPERSPKLSHRFCSQNLWLPSWIAFGSDCQMICRGSNLDSILKSANWPTSCKGYFSSQIPGNLGALEQLIMPKLRLGVSGSLPSSPRMVYADICNKIYALTCHIHGNISCTCAIHQYSIHWLCKCMYFLYAKIWILFTIYVQVPAAAKSAIICKYKHFTV